MNATTRTLLSLALLLASSTALSPGCSGKSEGSNCPGGEGCADVMPDGWIGDQVSADCGPKPNDGCNECYCPAGEWICTAMYCLDAKADHGPQPDEIEDAVPVSDSVPGMDYQVLGNCCSDSSECTSAMRCVGATAELQGTCQHNWGGSVCYFDSDCPQYFECMEETICTCGEECETVPGICQTAGAGCCEDDTDCPEGTTCYSKPDGSGSNCLPAPGQYWRCLVDSDCQEKETCVMAEWSVCGGAVAPFKYGFCQDDFVTQCIQTYTGCGCEQGCVDGYWAVVFYPEGEGPFPASVTPPEELLAVAYAKYECSICTCSETWAIHEGDEWLDLQEQGVEGFCNEINEMNKHCDGCLTTWQGGAG